MPFLSKLVSCLVCKKQITATHSQARPFLHTTGLRWSCLECSRKMTTKSVAENSLSKLSFFCCKEQSCGGNHLFELCSVKVDEKPIVDAVACAEITCSYCTNFAVCMDKPKQHFTITNHTYVLCWSCKIATAATDLDQELLASKSVPIFVPQTGIAH